jgi:hypothetical protein
MANKSPNRITISDVVATVHCEQKVVFDENIGDRTPQAIRIAKERGTVEHRQFAREATLKSSDTRCFVVSHVYGVHSVEANLMRSWRDAHLEPYWLGRVLVRLYYASSPVLIRHLSKSGKLCGLLRKGLSYLIAKGWFGHVDST